MTTFSCRDIVDHLNLYHLNAYPDDGGADGKLWAKWRIDFMRVDTADQYMLLVKYRRGESGGVVGFKHLFDGVDLRFLTSLKAEFMLRNLERRFDQGRMEIIETLDGLIKPKPKPFWHWNEPPKTYERKQYYIPVPKTMADVSKAQLYYEGLIA